MYRILAIGDLHLEGLNLYFTPLAALRMQCAQLADQLDYAMEEKFTDVVLLGDIFDNYRPSQRAVSMLTDVICDAKFHKAELRIHMYLGNHDMDGDDNSLLMLKQLERWCKHLYVYTESTVGEHIAFLCYPQTMCKQENTIVFCHKEFKGTKRDNGSVYDSEPFDHNLAAKRNQIWVSGHLHTEQSLYKRLFYPGTFPTKYLPEREHYLLRIDWDETQVNPTANNVSLIPWEPMWGLYRVDVRTAADEDEIHRLLSNKHQTVRVKAVVHAPYTLSANLKSDSRIIMEGNIPKLFTPNKGDVLTAANTDDAGWINQQLPQNIRKHPYLNRRAQFLIKKAQTLK